ncbi:hypothetical protein N8198_06725 [Gammaproteobacteria bacterium]|nr:hypothetical protein [Gammaproteobacteria bacterium]
MNETTTTKHFSDPRTLIPNGPLIKELRMIRGWTQEETAYQTHDTIERIAKTENPPGRFARRYRVKTANDQLAGISIGTLHSIENSNPAYPFTLKIIAETFGLPLQSLLRPDDLLGSSSPQIHQQAHRREPKSSNFE